MKLSFRWTWLESAPNPSPAAAHSDAGTLHSESIPSLVKADQSPELSPSLGLGITQTILDHGTVAE